MGKQEQWTPEEYKMYYNTHQKNKGQADRLKYGNIHAVIDGKHFDSKKEAEYYGQLKLMKKAGLIVDFFHHVTYPLMVNGKLICHYEADFVTLYPDGARVVIDVKSKATEGLPVFRLKRALMSAIHGIEIKIV